MESDDDINNKRTDTGQFCTTPTAVPETSTPMASMGQCSRTSTTVPKTNAPVNFMRLPEIIWLRVMHFLPLCDRYHMTLACELFHQLFFHPSLWRSVELTCFLVGDSRNGYELVLRPSHRQIALQFGHMFHFLLLRVSDCSAAVHEATARVLLTLAEKSSLRGLRLISESPRQTMSSGGAVSTDNCRGLVMDMVRKAKGLQYLDLSGWPVFCSNLDVDELNVLNALLSPDTCPHLQSLNIATKVMMDDSSLLEQFRQAVVRLVAKFSHLRHLHVRQTLLSDLLIHELASAERDRLLSLTVLNCEPGGDEDTDSSPRISDTSWSMLTSSCPRLEVHVQAEVANVPCIEWALTPHVPVVSVQLLFCSLPAHLLLCLKHVHRTLRSLTCHVLPAQCYDLPLTQLVHACTHLQHLVFYGRVHASTVLHLASLQRHWTTFSFRLKHIILVEESVSGGGTSGQGIAHGGSLVAEDNSRGRVPDRGTSLVKADAGPQHVERGSDLMDEDATERVLNTGPSLMNKSCGARLTCSCARGEERSVSRGSCLVETDLEGRPLNRSLRSSSGEGRTVDRGSSLMQADTEQRPEDRGSVFSTDGKSTCNISFQEEKDCTVRPVDSAVRTGGINTGTSTTLVEKDSLITPVDRMSTFPRGGQGLPTSTGGSSARIERGASSREEMLRELCVAVSTCLGYTWNPSTH